MADQPENEVLIELESSQMLTIVKQAASLPSGGLRELIVDITERLQARGLHSCCYAIEPAEPGKSPARIRLMSSLNDDLRVKKSAILKEAGSFLVFG